MRAKFIYEKFTQESDPINDMDIKGTTGLIYSIKKLIKLDKNKKDIIKNWITYDMGTNYVFELNLNMKDKLIHNKSNVRKIFKYLKDLIFESNLDYFLITDDNMGSLYELFELGIMNYTIKKECIKYFDELYDRRNEL